MSWGLRSLQVQGFTTPAQRAGWKALVIWLLRACRDKIRHFLAICKQGPFATQTTKFLLKCPRAKSHVADPLRVVLCSLFFCIVGMHVQRWFAILLYTFCLSLLLSILCFKCWTGIRIEDIEPTGSH